MPGLLFIPGISQPAALLLEAAGVNRPQDLAGEEAAALLERLEAINHKRRLLQDGLTLTAVQRWIGNARGFVERAESEGPIEAGDFSINLDEIPEVIVLDEPAATAATKMAPSYYRPAKPAPEFGRNFSKIAAQRAATTTPKHDATGEPVAVQPHLTAANDPNRLDPDAPVWKNVEKTKFRDFNSYVAGESGIAPLPRNNEEEVAEMAKVKLNPGEPLSRSVRRGVPHPRPWFVLSGALVVLLWRLLFLVVLVGTPLTLVPAFTHGDTEPLINFLWVIGGWVFVSLLYLAVSVRVRCRVCTNPIYVSKRCFKNVKAHRVFGLGLVGSLALHAMLFQWFRCMYCGTAIRLKFDGTAGKK